MVRRNFIVGTLFITVNFTLEGNALATDWSVWAIFVRRGGKLLTKRSFLTPTGKIPGDRTLRRGGGAGDGFRKPL